MKSLEFVKVEGNVLAISDYSVEYVTLSNIDIYSIIYADRVEELNEIYNYLLEEGN